MIITANKLYLPAWLARLCLRATIEKGIGHKYVRREPTGDPKKPWRYYYNLTSGRGHLDTSKIRDGAKFKIADGHVHITQLDGEHAEVVHDETGETARMHVHDLAGLIQSHHGEEIERVTKRQEVFVAKRRQRVAEKKSRRAMSLPRSDRAISSAIENEIGHDFGTIDMDDQRVRDKIESIFPKSRANKIHHFHDLVSELVKQARKNNEVRTWADLRDARIGGRLAGTDTIFDVIRELGDEIDDEQLKRATIPADAQDEILRREEEQHYRDQYGDDEEGDAREPEDGADTSFDPEMFKAEKLRGGRADGRPVSDFNASALREGVRHEMEHTDDAATAREIAADHLAEDPAYYKKLAKLETVTKSFRIPSWLAKALERVVEKAAGHKYLRRVPTGNPKRPWRYYYRVTGGKQLGHDDEIIAGAAFRAKDGDKEGHFHVVGVDGDNVTVRHDETGREATMQREALRAMLHAEHVEKINAAVKWATETRDAAEKHGSEKQKARARKHAEGVVGAFVKPEPKPAAPAAEIPTKHSGSEDAGVVVSFHPGEGILVHGTSRSQAAAIKEVMQKHGMRYSSQLDAWFKPKSRSWRASDGRAGSVHKIAEDLTSAGVEARGEQGFKNIDAAERESTRQERSSERAERMSERATKHAKEAGAQIDRANKLGERFYMGQPILVGHHSEKSARSAQKKMDTAMRRSIEAKDKAEHYASASASAERNAEGKTPTQMARKIDELEAEERKSKKMLERNPDSEQVKLRVEEIADDLTFWRGELKKTGFDADAARQTHKVGDIVLERGRPAIVRRVGPKNVTVTWLASPELGDQPGALLAGIKALTPEQQSALREKYAAALKKIKDKDAEKKAKPASWTWKGKRTTPEGHAITKRRDYGFDFAHPTKEDRSYSIHQQAFGDGKFYAEVTDKDRSDALSISRKTENLGKFDTLAEAVAAADRHAKSTVEKALAALEDLEKSIMETTSRYARIPSILGRKLWKALEADVTKAAGHKYLRRVPTGNPKRPWRYYYRVTGGKQLGHEDEMAVGAAFAVKHGDKAGHFHVKAIDGDKITIEHDESGHRETVTRDGLRAMLHAEHAEAIGGARTRAKAAADAAAKHGATEKMKSKTANATEKLEAHFGEKKPAKAPGKQNAISSTTFRKLNASLAEATGWTFHEVTVNPETGFARISVQRADEKGRVRMVTLHRSTWAGKVTERREVGQWSNGAFMPYQDFSDSTMLGGNTYGGFPSAMRGIANYIDDNRSPRALGSSKDAFRMLASGVAGAQAEAKSKDGEGTTIDVQAEPKSKLADALPEEIRDALARHLKTLQDTRTELDRYRKLGGRYEAEVAEKREDSVKRANEMVDEFLRLAKKNGVDGEAVIAELGGRPSTELSAAGAEWLRETKERKANEPKAKKKDAPKAEEKKPEPAKKAKAEKPAKGATEPVAPPAGSKGADPGYKGPIVKITDHTTLAKTGADRSKDDAWDHLDVYGEVAPGKSDWRGPVLDLYIGGKKIADDVSLTSARIIEDDIKRGLDKAGYRSRRTSDIAHAIALKAMRARDAIKKNDAKIVGSTMKARSHTMREPPKGDTSWMTKAPGFQPEKIKLDTRSGKVSVPALVTGDFGVHVETPGFMSDEPYTVTHTGSGMRAGTFETVNEALAAARYLSSKLDGKIKLGKDGPVLNDDLKAAYEGLKAGEHKKIKKALGAEENETMDTIEKSDMLYSGEKLSWWMRRYQGTPFLAEALKLERESMEAMAEVNATMDDGSATERAAATLKRAEVDTKYRKAKDQLAIRYVKWLESQAASTGSVAAEPDPDPGLPIALPMVKAIEDKLPPGVSLQKVHNAVLVRDVRQAAAKLRDFATAALSAQQARENAERLRAHRTTPVGGFATFDRR